MRASLGKEWAKLPLKSAQDPTFVALSVVRVPLATVLIKESGKHMYEGDALRIRELAAPFQCLQRSGPSLVCVPEQPPSTLRSRPRIHPQNDPC